MSVWYTLHNMVPDIILYKSCLPVCCNCFYFVYFIYDLLNSLFYVYFSGAPFFNYEERVVISFYEVISYAMFWPY